VTTRDVPSNDRARAGSDRNVHALHIDVAERGKMLALKGRHADALERYREALRMARAVQAPQLFARHYLHCVLESLEHMGSHDQAAALAGEAARAGATEAGATEADAQTPTPFQRRDRAYLLERQGMNQLKAGDVSAARVTLVAALTLDEALPLTRVVLDWTARGLSVNASRLIEAQRKYGYFIVRRDAVDPARARDPQRLTAELLHG